MGWRDQWIRVNKSAVANAIAQAFLLGFGFTAGERLVMGGFDIVAILQNFANRIWLIGFLQQSFNSAALAAIAVCRSNLFTNQNLNFIRNWTPDGVDTPPSSKP